MVYKTAERVSIYVLIWIGINILPVKYIAGFYATLIQPYGKKKNTSQLLGKIKILTLSPERFRKDLEILDGTDECDVFVINSKWQTRIIRCFYDLSLNEIDIIGGKTEQLKLKKIALRKFYSKFLTHLYEIIDVDIVISAGPNYIADYDWGVVSNKLEKPFIIFNRENLLYCEDMKSHLKQRLKRLNKFEGCKIFVHNAMTKELIVSVGYANNSDVVVVGCLRMDDYIKRIARKNNAEPRNSNDKKNLVLFSFGKLNSGLEMFFYKVHSRIIKFAKNNADINVIIKPKKNDEAWSSLFSEAVKLSGVNINGLDNLEVNDKYDAQDLILKADVVSGYNSTTMFESLIAGRQVVVPCFNDVFLNGNEKNIAYGQDINIFDVAYTEKDYNILIMKAMNSDNKTHKNMTERKKIFRKWISDPEGNAKYEYIKQIKIIINNEK